MPAPMLKPLLARFTDAELMIPQSRELEFQSMIAGIASSDYAKLVVEGQTDHMAANDDFWGEQTNDEWKQTIRPYTVVNGILQIPIRGVLLNNFPYQLFGYATGYAYIWEAFKRGMNDPNVKGIALICHTPGGEVAGNFDLVDRMYAYRGQKPIRGFAHEYAYSAGYSIISVADHVNVSRSGGVGSIGVVTSHVDISKMMDDMGWKVTFIHFGDHKVDANPYAALPKEVKDRIQARINVLGEEFVAIVGRNRNMELDAVRATQALTYPAQEAIEVGLADSIGPLDDALVVFEADINQQAEDETMSKTYNEEEYNAAVTKASTDGHAKGFSEGQAKGAADAQTRTDTVLGSAEGKDRPKASARLLKSSMSAEEIVGLLGDLPKETAEAAPATATATATAPAADTTNQVFTAAMAADKPDVGPDAGKEKANDSDMSALAKNFGLAGF